MRDEQYALLDGARLRMSQSRLDAAAEAVTAAFYAMWETLDKTPLERAQAIAAHRSAHERHRRLLDEHNRLGRQSRTIPIKFL